MLTDSAAFTWAITGTQSITVTVANHAGIVTGTAIISVTVGIPTYLPIILK